MPWLIWVCEGCRLLTAGRAFRESAHSAPELPAVPELDALYRVGARPRCGELIMVAGRSGAQKSGFAMFWVQRMGLKTLYFAGDMTAFEASSRLAAMQAREPAEQIELKIAAGDTAVYDLLLQDSRIVFAFGQPITWQSIGDHLDAWVELHSEWPECIVIDNLMDMQDADSDYQAQMQQMQELTALSRDTGCTVIVLHHATEKSPDMDPALPPSRRSIKGGLTEKPQLILGVAFVEQVLGSELRVAVLKQRSGRNDSSGRTFARLRAIPEETRFESLPEGSGSWEG